MYYIEKSIQYEIYLPNNNTKLDLSVCSNSNITIYIPIELNEKTQKIYDSLKEQGYNLFDKNDKFYHDLCTPYKSIDGTDVILLDRKNDIYENNKLVCQKNCEFSDYLSDSKYLKCDCNITNEDKIDTKEPEKITGKSIIKSFYNVLKYSNYKVLRCYNLVFRKVTIKENAGSILSNLYFIGYLLAFCIFCYYKTSYLDNEIEKLLSKEEKEEIDENQEIEIIKINKKKYDNNDILKMNNKINYNEKIETIGIKSRKSNKRKNKETVIYKDSFSDSKNLSSKNMLSNKLSIMEQDKSNNSKISKTSSEKSKNEKEALTDYELNDLEYNDAIELDHREFLNIYWYLLKREHIILFTFFNNNDYNLFSIKLSKLFLAICSDMAFNVFFFSDESMHKIYTSGGDNDFIGQFAQMVYSTIISQILQTFINYLTMTDINYYQLKALKKEKNIDYKKALLVVNCIKYKLIAFYSSTFLLFLFFWYTVSAFCAVYANTQGIFIGDSYTSFFMGLLYPFGLYLIPTALRFISLKAKEKKNLKILYSLSDKIPFF